MPSFVTPFFVSSVTCACCLSLSPFLPILLFLMFSLSSPIRENVYNDALTNTPITDKDNRKRTSKRKQDIIQALRNYRNQDKGEKQPKNKTKQCGKTQRIVLARGKTTGRWIREAEGRNHASHAPVACECHHLQDGGLVLHNTLQQLPEYQ